MDARTGAGVNFVLHGHAVSTGITIGQAHLVSTARLEVAHYEIEPEQVDAEIARFDAALHAAREELSDLKAHIPAGRVGSSTRSRNRSKRSGSRTPPTPG